MKVWMMKAKFKILLPVLIYVSISHAAEHLMLPAEAENITAILSSQLVDSHLSGSFLSSHVVAVDGSTTTDDDDIVATINKRPSMHSCHDIKSKGVTKSGYYWIDPDGVGSGNPAFKVYCHMNTGVTEVTHNLADAVDIGSCSGPGCDAHIIQYHASLNQITSLIAISKSCQQYIRYDCRMSPLQIGNKAYGWWEDREGQQQYYWSGTGNSGHLCSCHQTNSCRNPRQKCNCDGNVPVWLFDEGYITNKDHLPLTKLAFGSSGFDLQRSRVRLGRLECSGLQVEETALSSCKDLKQSGERNSGFYVLAGRSKRIMIAYCNFALPSNHRDFEKTVDMGSMNQRLNQLENNVRGINTQLQHTNKGVYNSFPTPFTQDDKVMAERDTISHREPVTVTEPLSSVMEIEIRRVKRALTEKMQRLESDTFSKLNVMLNGLKVMNRSLDNHLKAMEDKQNEMETFSVNKINVLEGDVGLKLHELEDSLIVMDKKLTRNAEDLAFTENTIREETIRRLVFLESSVADLQDSAARTGPEIETAKLITSQLSKEIADLKQNVGESKQSVAFNAYRAHSFKKAGTVTYDGTTANQGNGMDITTGIFTAPVDGIYMFMFSAETKKGWKADFIMRKNGQPVTSAYDSDFNEMQKQNNNRYSMINMASMQKLNINDKVLVENWDNESKIHDSSYRRTQFLGLLVNRGS